MASLLGGLTPLLWILGSFIAVVQGDFEQQSPVQSLTEVETRLPCRFKVEVGQVVVQVTWTKERADGTKDQIITVHHTAGQTEFGQYSGRVRFASSEPTVDSSLIIMNTVESDEGRYNCHISTFPSGNFEQQLSLTVWNPPNAEISGFNHNWYAGLEGAALSCVSGGNPKPQSFTWTRKGGDLPEGVTAGNGSLLFNRPLGLTDAGIYQCVAYNVVGTGKAEVEITVTELPQKPVFFNSLLMIIVGGVAGGLLLIMVIIVILVTRHHKRKNKKLERELTVKKEEISTLSRQASFRRVNSVSTDARGQMEENIPLRVEGTLRTSLSSLGDPGRIRDSRSTLVGGGGLDYQCRPVLNNSSRRGRENRAMDREEENRLRVESYVRNSTMSLGTRLHLPIQPSPFPMEQSTKLLRSLNGSVIIPTEGGLHARNSPLSCSYPPVTDDEQEEGESVEGERGTSSRMSHLDQGRSEDQDNSSQISDAERGHNHHFQQNNGTLRPKPRPNGIPSPHASLIHKAQIV